MKATVLKNNFKKGLNITERVTGKNLNLPILNNILISGEKNFLHLTATDLEIGVNYWVLAKIEEEGKIVVSVKLLSALINSLISEKINLETQKSSLILEGENYKTQIKCLSPEEFPIIPTLEKEKFIEINSSLFSKALSQVVDFCTPSQIKPELSGVFFKVYKDQIKLVATDSFRLAEKIISQKKDSLSQEAPGEYSCILPQKSAREMVNIFSEKESDFNQDSKLGIYFSPNQILFEFPKTTSADKPQFQLISRLIEGDFPDYQEIIPKEWKTQVILSKEEFVNQIKAASLFSGNVNEIKFKIIPQKGILEIFSQNPELGENKSHLFAKIKGDPLEVSFNYRFLLDGLVNIKSPEVVLGFNKEENPLIMKPVGDDSYLYIVMPIKN